jgi:tellurite methyltransferase
MLLAMQRAIEGFERDEDGEWVARLACGHRQHVRHKPPFQERAWLTTEAGRRDKLGSLLDCLFCNMAELPLDVRPYKETARFTETSLPSALQHDHRTKPGVWAQIVVEEGKLEYTCERGCFVLREGVVGVVEPARPHRVRPLGPVRFFVRFLAAPAK